MGAKLSHISSQRARPYNSSDGTYIIAENICPICAAATACQGFCRSELALFERLLAPAQVERSEHLLAGCRRRSTVLQVVVVKNPRGMPLTHRAAHSHCSPAPDGYYHRGYDL
jgi:hypothetical protein